MSSSAPRTVAAFDPSAVSTMTSSPSTACLRSENIVPVPSSRALRTLFRSDSDASRSCFAALFFVSNSFSARFSAAIDEWISSAMSGVGFAPAADYTALGQIN